MIRTFCAELELARPVVLGCSIGGRIVLNLAVITPPSSAR